MNPMIETETLTEEVIETIAIKEKAIVVYNDDVNTFDHVIETLMKYCNHESEQATQCAYIIHYKGQCDVKNGSYKTLKPICEALLENGLTAKIEIKN